MGTGITPFGRNHHSLIATFIYLRFLSRKRAGGASGARLATQVITSLETNGGVIQSSRALSWGKHFKALSVHQVPALLFDKFVNLAHRATAPFHAIEITS
jgi:hypothetical protein